MRPGQTESAEEIVRRSGSNLAFALALLPPEKRADMRIFYGFCRLIDDIADDPDRSPGEKARELDRWKSLAAGRCDHPAAGIESEFDNLVRRRGLDRELLVQIVEGVEMDIEAPRFVTVEDLRRYCFRVASAVGLVSIELFGYRNPRCRVYAEELGYALQWVNIIRDVGEDARQGRLYLPLAELEAFGLTPEEILENRFPRDRFVALMARQAERAREFCGRALAALPVEDRASMRSPELMRRIYFGILRKIERDGYHVFAHRYRLSKLRMLAEFLRARYVS